MHIGLFSKDDHESHMVCIETIEFFRKHGVNVLVKKELYEKLLDISPTLDNVITSETPHKDSDIVIIVGGDGSVLSFVRENKIYNKPILPINTGRRGILSEVKGSDATKALEKVIGGDYYLEKLPLLKVTNKGGIPPAINEVLILSTENIGKISCFRLMDDNRNFICNVECDGIIVASSLGSTAYSLSAGGAVLHPLVDAYIVAFINPLNRNLLSLVMPFKTGLIIEMVKPSTADIFIDGEKICKVDGSVMIEKSKKSVVFVRLTKPPRSFYKRLRKRIA